jgi:uncharacterized protein YjdB
MFLGVTALLLACSGSDPMAPHDPYGPAASSAVATITIEPATGLLSPGRTLQLKVVLRDAAGFELTNRTIIFTSSDERVLSVDARGMVLALAEGAVTLTATSEGKSDRKSIAVVPVENDPCEGCWDYSPIP